MNILPSLKQKPQNLTKTGIFDNQTHDILNRIKDLNIGKNFDINNYFNTSISTVSTSGVANKKSIEEKLFDARARVKIETSRVSMHLNQNKIEKLFSQIDSMHDPEDWDEELSAINLSSYQSFLMWYLLVKPEKGASLGLTDGGNLIAAWVKGDQRLILEFLPNHKVKWFVARYLNDDLETASGNALIERMPTILAPYGVAGFFDKE